METLLEILNDIDDTVNWEDEIDASEIVPENFNSADAMWKMIQRLQEN